MSLKALFLRLALAAGPWAVSPAVGCERLPLLEPAPGATVSDARPWLVWPAGAPARVQLAQIAPESGLLRTDDVWVAGDRLRLPAAAVGPLTSVKVIVSRHCPHSDAAALQAQGPAFFIELGARCSVDAARLRVRDGVAQWPAVPGAGHYRARVLQGSQWQAGQAWGQRGAQELRGNEWRLPIELPTERMVGPAALVVEAVCDGIAGTAAVHLLSGP